MAKSPPSIPTTRDDCSRSHALAGSGCSIEELAALCYAGKDWHKLTPFETTLVDKLEGAGYLTVNKPANGFVGKAILSQNKLL